MERQKRESQVITPRYSWASHHGSFKEDLPPEAPATESEVSRAGEWFLAEGIGRVEAVGGRA